MNTATLVWLVVFVVLAVLFVLTLRRMSVLVGRTHELERYQRLVRSLDKRLAQVADPFVAQLDEIRRRSGDPRTLGSTIAGVQEALREISADGRAARIPKGLSREAIAFTVELDRAVRASDLVEHGLDALLADRGGRDLEAQTSLKRGALNMRHAREAVTRLAGDIAAIRPVDLRDRLDMGVRGTAGAAVPTYIVDEEPDSNG
jgi:hypothetical protein